jgi:hypothetical protein
MFADARLGSAPTSIYYARIKLLVWDKHSYLFGISVRDAEEKVSKH